MLMREDNSRLTKTKTFTSYLPVPSCLHAHLRGRTTEYIIIVIAEICQDWLMIWSTGNARLDSLEGWATQITGFKSTKKKKKAELATAWRKHELQDKHKCLHTDPVGLKIAFMLTCAHVCCMVCVCGLHYTTARACWWLCLSRVHI